jgi:hypothetical protein
MLVAAAFVPAAPLLLPALGGGPAELRSACRQAVGVLGGVDRIVVLGAGRPGGWRTGSVDATGWGAPGEPSADPLPLPLAVGSSLLGARPHELLAVPGPAELLDRQRRTGVLVVADGTAKRTEKAPGHFDLRAEGFDQAVESAVCEGDPAALAALDEALAGQLLVDGLAAWRACAELAEREVVLGGGAPHGWAGEVIYAAAPFGVGYLVATWLPGAADLAPA